MDLENAMFEAASAAKQRADHSRLGFFDHITKAAATVTTATQAMARESVSMFHADRQQALAQLPELYAIHVARMAARDARDQDDPRQALNRHAALLLHTCSSTCDWLIKGNVCICSLSGDIHMCSASLCNELAQHSDSRSCRLTSRSYPLHPLDIIFDRANTSDQYTADRGSDRGGRMDAATMQADYDGCQAGEEGEVAADHCIDTVEAENLFSSPDWHLTRSTRQVLRALVERGLQCPASDIDISIDQWRHQRVQSASTANVKSKMTGNSAQPRKRKAAEAKNSNSSEHPAAASASAPPPKRHKKNTPKPKQRITAAARRRQAFQLLSSVSPSVSSSSSSSSSFASSSQSTASGHAGQSQRRQHAKQPKHAAIHEAVCLIDSETAKLRGLFPVFGRDPRLSRWLEEAASIAKFWWQNITRTSHYTSNHHYYPVLAHLALVLSHLRGGFSYAGCSLIPATDKELVKQIPDQRELLSALEVEPRQLTRALRMFLPLVKEMHGLRMALNYDPQIAQASLPKLICLSGPLPSQAKRKH